MCRRIAYVPLVSLCCELLLTDTLAVKEHGGRNAGYAADVFRSEHASTDLYPRTALPTPSRRRDHGLQLCEMRAQHLPRENMSRTRVHKGTSSHTLPHARFPATAGSRLFTPELRT